MVGEDVASHRYRYWPALVTALLSLAISLVVWSATRTAEQRHIRRMARLATQAIREDLRADTESWVQDLVQLAKLWESERGPSYREWRANAELYLRHHPGSVALERVQAKGGETWLIRAPHANDQFAGLVDIKDGLLQQALLTGAPQLSTVVRGSDGRQREIIAAPIVIDQEVKGFVVAFVDVQTWFQDMLRDVVPLGYSVAVRERNAEIFRYAEGAPQGMWLESDSLALPGTRWELSIWPKQTMLAELRSRLPEAALLACILLGVLSTLAMHLAQQAAATSSHLHLTNLRLAAVAEEQRASQAALSAAQARLTAILENSADAVISLDKSFQITLFNHAAETMFGYKQEEVLGKHVDMLIPARFRSIHHQHIAKFDQSTEHNLKMSNRKPVLGIRKDGTEFPIDAPLARLEINGEKVFTVIIRDITERIRNEEELLKSRDQLELRVRERTTELQELSNRLAQLQDEDRRRIARELHDGTTQILIALNVDLGMIERTVGESNPEIRHMLVGSRELVQQCLDELRTVSYLLHPPLLDELGLDLALRNYVKGFSCRSEIGIEMQLPPGLDSLPRDIQLAVFRILQEALTNIHRHSESPTARILLRHDGNDLRMEIADQGRGISRGVLENADGGAGIGIASMRERVRQLGGTFHIEVQHGTTIRVTLPVPTATSSEQQDAEDAAARNGIAQEQRSAGAN